jgi:hypothetical protein
MLLRHINGHNVHQPASNVIPVSQEHINNTVISYCYYHHHHHNLHHHRHQFHHIVIIIYRVTQKSVNQILKCTLKYVVQLCITDCVLQLNFQLPDWNWSN